MIHPEKPAAVPDNWKVSNVVSVFKRELQDPGNHKTGKVPFSCRFEQESQGTNIWLDVN